MSVIAVAVKHMLAAGMDADAIYAAVAEMEASMAKVRSVGAIRQQRYRDRNKASQSVTRYDSDASDASDAPLPPPEEKAPTPPKTQPPSAPKETPPIGGAKKNPSPLRGSRLAADWRPSSADEAYAANCGLAPESIVREAERFRNYWLAKAGRDATKLDWSRTWQNWALKASEQQPQQGGTNGHHQQPQRRTTADLAREFADYLGAGGADPLGPLRRVS